jgi:endonuclease VIII
MPMGSSGTVSSRRASSSSASEEGVCVPEGPSIVILREEAAKFTGKKILGARTLASLEASMLIGQRVVALRSWGKHFLIQLPRFSIRIHFLLFGSYLIDSAKKTPPRLALRFANGEINFYACSVQVIGQDLDAVYDWSADVMSDGWDAAKARKKLRARSSMLACDALLDQQIFSGAGNIIKNEVLFRTRVHPLSTIGSLPARKLRQLVEETRNYCFDFLTWKKGECPQTPLVGAHKEGVPALSAPANRTGTRKNPTAQFFLQSLSGEVWLDCRE